MWLREGPASTSQGVPTGKGLDKATLRVLVRVVPEAQGALDSREGASWPITPTSPITHPAPHSIGSATATGSIHRATTSRGRTGRGSVQVETHGAVWSSAGGARQWRPRPSQASQSPGRRQSRPAMSTRAPGPLRQHADQRPGGPLTSMAAPMPAGTSTRRLVCSSSRNRKMTTVLKQRQSTGDGRAGLSAGRGQPAAGARSSTKASTDCQV